MTRETIFQKIRMGECVNGFAPKWLIELIREAYDSFEQKEKELQDRINELEQRTCEGCKYSEYHVHQDILECFKLYESQQCYSCNTPIQIFEVTKDFGCNKWEKKDD